jgi:hypothetical protein
MNKTDYGPLIQIRAGRREGGERRPLITRMLSHESRRTSRTRRSASSSPLLSLSFIRSGSRPPPRRAPHTPARPPTMLLHLVSSSSPLSPARPTPRRPCLASAAVRCAASSSSSTPSPSSSAAATAAVGQQVAKVHNSGTVDYERRAPLRWGTLYRRIAVGHGGRPVGRTLGDWDEGERRLDKWELCRIAKELRKFRRFNLALQVASHSARSAYTHSVTSLQDPFPFDLSR